MKKEWSFLGRAKLDQAPKPKGIKFKKLIAPKGTRNIKDYFMKQGGPMGMRGKVGERPDEDREGGQS